MPLTPGRTTSFRDAAHKIILIAPLIALLCFLGLSSYFIPESYSRYLAAFWFYLVAFLLAYVPADIVMRHGSRSEKTRLLLFVYGVVLGGVVANAFGRYFLLWTANLTDLVDISVIVVISSLAPILLLWRYERSNSTARASSLLPEHVLSWRKVAASIMIFLLLLTAALTINALTTPITDFTKPVFLPMSLNYPSYSTVGLVIGQPNDSMHIDLSLYANHTIAEETPVLLTAYGSIGSVLARNISQLELGRAEIFAVKVGFEGAFQVVGNSLLESYGPPLAGTLMLVNSSIPCGTSSISYGPTTLCGLPTVITWPVEGDYNPVISIMFKNGSSIDQPYPDYKVHVTSSQVIQSENLNERNTQINIGLSTALLLFSFISALKLVSEILKPETKENSQRT